jgi:hypothetical protein
MGDLRVPPERLSPYEPTYRWNVLPFHGDLGLGVISLSVPLSLGCLWTYIEGLRVTTERLPTCESTHREIILFSCRVVHGAQGILWWPLPCVINLYLSVDSWVYIVWYKMILVTWMHAWQPASLNSIVPVYKWPIVFGKWPKPPFLEVWECNFSTDSLGLYLWP